jgi:hypothetical protein
MACEFVRSNWRPRLGFRRLRCCGYAADNKEARAQVRAHTADRGLDPAASPRWVFLLLLSGPAICWLSLSGRWFRGATDPVGLENRAAHRRSHRL